MAEEKSPLGVSFDNLRDVQHLLKQAEAAFSDIERINIGQFDATIHGTYQRDRLDADELEAVATALIQSRRRKLAEIARKLSKFGVFLSPDEPHKPFKLPSEMTNAR